MGAWSLWKLRPPALAYFLAVQILAIALVILVVTSTPPPQADALLVFTMLALTAGTVIVATSVSIYLRQRTRTNPWTVHVCYLAAGILTLPPNLLALLLLGPALHGVLDVRPQLHRWMFTTGATVIAVFSARFVIGWTHPQWEPMSIVLSGTVLLLIRAGVVAIGWRLRDPGAAKESVIGEQIDVVLGITAVCLGGILGIAVVAAPYSALLAGPPLALLDFASQLPQYRRSAQRDGKTGLSNSIHWEHLARAELTRAHSRNQHTSALLLDLDHFKRVNDEIGHIAGDTVLAAVALMLASNVRRKDIVGRFGGEEFVVLLPGSGAEMARTVANRIRASTESLSVPVRDTHGHQQDIDNLTVSIGVATTSRYGYEFKDLLVAADAAMLSAKSSGRNAVTVA